jgi:hypothetical protein
MGLDIRKPIGLLFSIIAVELFLGGTPSFLNTICAAAYGLFGVIFLYLGWNKSGGTRKNS